MNIAEEFEFGRWACTMLNMATPWPSIRQEIIFRDRCFHLLPQFDDRFPSVAVKLDEGESYGDLDRPINRFLSVLAWAGEAKLKILGHGGSSRYPNPMGGFSRQSFHFMPYYRGAFPIQSLADVDEDTALGLAFWREASAMEWARNEYSLLSFFKIIEAQHSDKDARIAFFDRALASILRDTTFLHADGRKSLSMLQQGGKTNIALYLYESCRGSLAHGASTRRNGDPLPIFDPDDPAEEKRIQLALPLMKAAAYVCIVEDYGVLPPRDFLRLTGNRYRPIA